MVNFFYNNSKRWKIICQVVLSFKTLNYCWTVLFIASSQRVFWFVHSWVLDTKKANFNNKIKGREWKKAKNWKDWGLMWKSTSEKGFKSQTYLKNFWFELFHWEAFLWYKADCNFVEILWVKSYSVTANRFRQR